MEILTDKIQTERFRMNYLRFGTGKRTLVILPGLSVQGVVGSAGQIAEAYGFMADEFTVYLFDRRLDPPPVYTVRDMAEDTVQAIRAVGINDLCLFGASQGGMIALQIAIDHPDLVRKIAVGSSSSDLKGKTSALLEEWIRFAKAKDRRGLYLSFGKSLYPPDVFERYKSALLAAAETVTEEDLKRFLVYTEGMKDFCVVDQVKKIQCPALVIGVYEDAVLDSDMTMEIAEQLDRKEGFELYMYKGYGHAAYDTAPDYRERLYRFFLKP